MKLELIGPALQVAVTMTFDRACEALAQGTPWLQLRSFFRGLQAPVLETLMNGLKPQNGSLNYWGFSAT